ncbi:hypothetical protein WBK31_09135 [Nonomuraea sp. N2-4H]|uniref:PfkB family carbohydrate kinase n=1 Tax=Nonomuraea sp. N2-4H TaxID=3128898 RepID=UPI0032474E83
MKAGPLVVIGDTLLDVDVEGVADRLCPDAPVPVVDVSSERARPGGAGLAALLAARDGADVVLVTAVGDDEDGRRLCGLLSEELDLLRLPLRGGTVRKTRIRSRGQTLVRLDTGDGTARFSPPRRRRRRSCGRARCWCPTTVGASPGWPASCCARSPYRWCGTRIRAASSRYRAARC